MANEMDWLDEAQQAYDRKKGTTGFGYDAISDSKRRRSPKKTVSSEDRHLKQSERKGLIATSRDIRRNFSIARFLIHRHIDYVVEHNMIARTGNRDTDDKLTEFFRMASRKENFDVTGRYGLRRYLRMMEAARIVDGDILTVKFRRGHVQAIEGDRIRNPENQAIGSIVDDIGWVNGVKIDQHGGHQAYSIHRRKQSGFDWERTVPKRKAMLHGFFDRFDQTRGISPLTPVINSMKDLYESWDYALARSKVEQLFALAITRTDDWGAGLDDEDDDENNVRELSFDKGPQILDLDSDEDAKFLSSSSPANSTQDFWHSMIMMTLKALMIPYFFYDEKNTNFFGARSSLLMYIRSVRGWREDIVEFLNEWFCWRLKVGIQNGEIDLPESFDCDDYTNWAFQPIGLEYWNPKDEIKADETAIALKIRTRDEIRMERFGDSWTKDVFPKLLEEEKLVKQLTPPPNVNGGLNQPNREDDDEDSDEREDD